MEKGNIDEILAMLGSDFEYKTAVYGSLSYIAIEKAILIMHENKPGSIVIIPMIL